MQPTYGEASTYLQPTFAQAEQALQGQTPAIQNLYAALIQGLQAQGGAQTQNVLASAARRGVGRAMLGSDVQNQLGQELALQTGQLGAQQAQAVAAAQQAVGKLGVERVSRVSDLANSLQEAHLNRVKTQNEMSNLDRNQQLKLQEADREFQVAQAAYQRRQAEAAAAARQKAAKEAPTTSQALLTIAQLWQPGKDGYVNPKQWNELRKAFMEAGYSGSSFDAEFKNLVNPEHVYRDSKLPRYTGVGLKD